VRLVSRQAAQRSRAAVIHCEACLDLSKRDERFIRQYFKSQSPADDP
jgi:hypothetical protein